MDPVEANNKNVEKNRQEEYNKRYNEIVKKWSEVPERYKSIFKILPILIILAAIPLTVNLSQKPQNIQQNAQTVPTLSPTPSIISVTVSSIAALKIALADNSLDEIVVTNGTYHVSPASDMQSDSLWIGAQFASRTRPITVRAQTTGGVTFDGGGTTYYGCISFEQGAHDQTWDGFNCAGGEATMTGIVTIAGYPNSGPSYALPPYNITMNNITILPSCTGNSLVSPYPANDHAFYISNGGVGPHDILFNNITVDGSGGLASAFHFYHSDATNLNGWNIKVTNLHVKGTQQAVMLWDSTLKNITFDTADIVNPTNYAVRYETKGSTGIVLQNIKSNKGFYSSQGSAPIGVSFINDAFNSSVYFTPTPTPTLTPLVKYSCNNSGGCVQSTSGQYTTSNCNNACVLPTPTPTLTLTPTPIPPTPTLKPTYSPAPFPTSTPTIKPSTSPTIIPTPTLTPGRTKKCIKLLFWKFCF